MISWFTSGKQTIELHRWFCYETHFILYIISIAGNVPYVNEPVFVDFGLSVLQVRPAAADPAVIGVAASNGRRGAWRGEARGMAGGAWRGVQWLTVLPGASVERSSTR